MNQILSSLSSFLQNTLGHICLSDHIWGTGCRATQEAALSWERILPESLVFLHILQQRHWSLFSQTFFSRYLYSEQLWEIERVFLQSKGPARLLFLIKDSCFLRSEFLFHSVTHWCKDAICRHLWGSIHIALRCFEARGIDANMLMLMLFAVLWV